MKKKSFRGKLIKIVLKKIGKYHFFFPLEDSSKRFTENLKDSLSENLKFDVIVQDVEIKNGNLSGMCVFKDENGIPRVIAFAISPNNKIEI